MARNKKEVKKKPVMTLAQEEAEARKLGLSYGTYIGYVQTGYLEKYRRELKERKEPVGNIIESNISGSRGKFKTRHDKKIC